jgi:hypothetical protein
MYEVRMRPHGEFDHEFKPLTTIVCKRCAKHALSAIVPLRTLNYRKTWVWLPYHGDDESNRVDGGIPVEFTEVNKTPGPNRGLPGPD